MRNDTFTIFRSFKRNALPALDYFYDHMINIPVGWWMSEELVHTVCDIIRSGW